MPPKQRITREMILETSFEMFCREGMEIVNARSVAKALNCSTQPIFSYFAGMDDLKNALEEKARLLFEEGIYQAVQGEEPLFDGCMAYFRFAMQQPNLFRQLFLKKMEKTPANLIKINEALEEKAVNPIVEKTGIDLETVKKQCIKLWVYAHGLASLAAMGLLSISEDKVNAMMREAEKNYALK